MRLVQIASTSDGARGGAGVGGDAAESVTHPVSPGERLPDLWSPAFPIETNGQVAENLALGSGDRRRRARQPKGAHIPIPERPRGLELAEAAPTCNDGGHGG